MLSLGSQVEDLMKEFDFTQNKHEHMHAVSFNNDDLYKEVINEVRVHRYLQS